MSRLQRREERLRRPVPAWAAGWVCPILLGIGAAFGAGLGQR